MLDLQIKQAEEERDVLDGQLPRGGPAVAERLAAAERELAAWRSLSPLEHASGGGPAGGRRRPRGPRRPGGESRAARRRWRERSAGAGLPVGLTPGRCARMAAPAATDRPACDGA